MKLPYKCIMAAVADGGSKEYSYFVKADVEVKEEDFVLIWVRNTPSLAQVTRVTGISKAERDKATKVIGGVVGGLEDWKADMEALKKYMELRSKLNEMREQYDEMQVFTLLAQQDPDAKSLMNEMAAMLGTPALTADK